MKNSKKFARIMAILLTIVLLLSFIVPAFSMLVRAEGLPDDTQPQMSVSDRVNSDGDAFIISFSADGMLEEGVGKTVKITVSDQRVNFSGCDDDKIGIMINRSTSNFASGTPEYTIDSKDASGVIYTITLPDFTYLGGDKTLTFDVSYTVDGSAVPVGLRTFQHTVTQIAQPTPTPVPTPEPTPEPTPTPAPKDIEIDSSKDVFIQSYKVSDKATGKELTVVNPGQTVKLRFNVIDNRITYTSEAPQMRARMSQGSFKNNDYGDVRYQLMNVGTINGRKILAYQVTFDNVVYQGGSQQTSFDISYTTANGTAVTVPYTELTQVITQAVDDIPEPKIVLNSAEYGSAAYIDKAFTLSTVATNSSEYMDLENVSVRVELPSGIAMAEGNSQVLVGNVGKGGKISHDFRLVVTGAESTVTSLPVNIVYEYEAFVKGTRRTYTSQQTVAINIEQETKFEISKLEYMEAITAGEEDCVTVYLLNKGKTSANNVTIEIHSQQLNGPQTVFAGNIVPGTESIQDVYFTVYETGIFEGTVVVTYENTKGKQATIEQDFSMEVMEPYVYEWDEPIYDVPVTMEEPASFPWIAVIAVAVVVIVVTAVIISKKRKNKKNTEDEDEDI